MKIRVSVIEIKGDECLSPDEIASKINQALLEHKVSAEDIISITQPSHYTVTRVFFRTS